MIVLLFMYLYIIYIYTKFCENIQEMYMKFLQELGEHWTSIIKRNVAG